MSEGGDFRVQATCKVLGGQNCRLHPLIHTFLKFNLVQDVVSCQCGKENPLERKGSLIFLNMRNSQHG